MQGPSPGACAATVLLGFRALGFRAFRVVVFFTIWGFGILGFEVNPKP